MSSPPRLPSKPPPTTTTITDTPNSIASRSPSLPVPPPLLQSFPSSTQPIIASSDARVQPVPPLPPAIKTGSPTRPSVDGSDSEAETVVLPGAIEHVHRKKDILQNGGERDMRGNGRGEEDEVESPRKKRRKRNDSRSQPTEPATGEHRLKVAGDDDAAFSSDLSSAPSRTSQPISPAHQHVTAMRLHRHNNHGNGRKRKVSGGSSTSEEDRVDSHHRARRRRSSILDYSPSRRIAARSSPPLLSLPSFSPNRVTKSRASQTGQRPHKHRKLPPPLVTGRDEPSDDGNTSSSSSSRHASPSIPTLPRPQPATRTPGSPVSMSHKAKRDTAGRTHLHKACQRGIVADVENILENSTDFLNSEDNAGYMPIHEACLHGNLDCVKKLISYGALFDVPSKYDYETPLLDAVDNGTQSPGHVAVIKYLLDMGADPRKRDKQGRTCFDANDEANSHELDTHRKIEELLKTAISKQRVQRPSDDENTRASVPADRDSHSSRDPSVASPSHRSPPLTSAPATHSRRRNARTEQSRKDLLWLDSGKGSVQKLREKSREGDLQMVHALLETGVAPDTETLIGAIKGGHTELVSLLLAYNAVVDPVAGQNGRESSRKTRDVSTPAGDESPMNAAIGRGNVTILRYLLENGANPRKLDSRGKSYADIAREREGEYWQNEVELLEDAWNKAGGNLKASKPTSSPHRKSPQKPKSSREQRRNSTSSNSKQLTRTPHTKSSTDKDKKRSVSVNPSSCLDENATISDRESTIEPSASSKYRLGKPRRSESDSITPIAVKKKRRLVPGKLLAEEEVLSRNESKSEEPRAKKLKTEQLDEPEAKDSFAADHPLQKPKLERETERQPPPMKPERDSSDALKKLSTNEERAHSPPKAPRANLEKWAEADVPRKKRANSHNSDGIPRRDSLVEPNGSRKLKDTNILDLQPVADAVSSSVSRLPEEPESRHSSREAIVHKLRQKEADRRRREREEVERKDAETRERLKREKERRVREREIEKERKEEARQRSLEEEARELLRQKHLTRELHSIQRKASIESKAAQENEVINRELALRAQREQEELRDRIRREAIEREQEERETRPRGFLKAVEDTGEGKEREVRESREDAMRKREKEQIEEHKRVIVEQKRKEEAARDREVELAVKAREFQELQAREREAVEKCLAEQKRLEEEALLRKQEEEKEKERRREEEKKRLSEQRRQKEEDDKRRLEQEQQEERQRQIEAERKRKVAEEERRRQEVEKAQRDQEAKKVAEELQAQLAAAERKRCEEEALEKRRIEEEKRVVRERARVQSLPYILRHTTENEAKGLEVECYSHFIPLFTATLSMDPATTPVGSMQNGGQAYAHNKWVLNVQVALLFGTTDLALSKYSQIEHRTVSDHERARMWSVMAPLLCEKVTSTSAKTIEEVAAAKRMEGEKFRAMDTLFWVKFDDVQKIVASEPKLKHHISHLDAVEVSLDVPTPSRPTKEELALRVARRFGLSIPNTLDSANLLERPREPDSMLPPAASMSFSINNCRE